MSFNANIPQPTDIPANSQPQLLANFTGINTLVNVNHVGFDLADQGKHKWVTYPDQVATNPATLSTEVATYCITSADTTNLELTFRRPSNGAIIAMTAAGGTTNGWTMLPSGILIKWASVNATGLQTINANAFGKAFTTIYSIQLTNQTVTSSSNTYVMGGVITGTTFDIYVGNRTTPGTDATTEVNWLAIGV